MKTVILHSHDSFLSRDLCGAGVFLGNGWRFGFTDSSTWIR
jgi:hypothetical protein